MLSHATGSNSSVPVWYCLISSAVALFFLTMDCILITPKVTCSALQFPIQIIVLLFGLSNINRLTSSLLISAYSLTPFASPRDRITACRTPRHIKAVQSS
ncbi:hypothetical protein AcW1_002162 [Taiwanofungus camphoratus]|nr:hypothetical protein AcW1_002162 [Antrodia cinnamomea]